MRTFDFKGREAHDIRQTFGDLPLVEAKAEMIVYVSRAEIDHSVRADPHNCMFSNACKRAFGSRAVLFYPTIAYVDMLDENGQRIVMRFRIGAKARAAIEAFDNAEGPQVEGTFKLSPVGKGQTLAESNKRARQRQRNIQNGQHTVSPTRSDGAKRAAETRRDKALLGLRVGTPT